mmetsp:Transcript_15955/g.38070  ORF Transcript_15955/g.38070 Transcript_15955/m.38070 type:complete len:325 (+) Transcript_15955:110-1084(+)
MFTRRLSLLGIWSCCLWRRVKTTGVSLAICWPDTPVRVGCTIRSGRTVRRPRDGGVKRARSSPYRLTLCSGSPRSSAMTNDSTASPSRGVFPVCSPRSVCEKELRCLLFQHPPLPPQFAPVLHPTRPQSPNKRHRTHLPACSPPRLSSTRSLQPVPLRFTLSRPVATISTPLSLRRRMEGSMPSAMMSRPIAHGPLTRLSPRRPTVALLHTPPANLRRNRATSPTARLGMSPLPLSPRRMGGLTDLPPPNSAPASTRKLDLGGTLVDKTNQHQHAEPRCSDVSRHWRRWRLRPAIEHDLGVGGGGKTKRSFDMGFGQSCVGSVQ